jgi:hypothetical protein
MEFNDKVAVITGAATAAAFTTASGTPSAAQSFAVSGLYLTADITATAPTGFEVSSDGSTYATTATFTQTCAQILSSQTRRSMIQTGRGTMTGLDFMCQAI